MPLSLPDIALFALYALWAAFGYWAAEQVNNNGDAA